MVKSFLKSNALSIRCLYYASECVPSYADNLAVEMVTENINVHSTKDVEVQRISNRIRNSDQFVEVLPSGASQCALLGNFLGT